MNERLVHPIFVAATGILILVCASPVLAADRHFNVNSGLWSSTTSWTPAIVPAPADNALIDFYNGAPGLARITTTAIGAVTSVRVSNGGTVQISNQGSLLCGGDFIIGLSSTNGALNVQTNNPILAFPGGLTVGANLRLGTLSGVGQVNQNAGTVAVGSTVYVGDTRDTTSAFSPVGTYSLSGTGVLRSPTVYLGYNISSSGAMNLSGFARAQIDYLGVGTQYGLGVVNQTGGNMNVSAHTSIGSTYGQGTYNLSGGTFTSAAVRIDDDSILNFTGGATSLGEVSLWGGRIALSGGGNKVLRLKSLELNHPYYGSVVDLGDNMMRADSYGYWWNYDIGRAYNGGLWNGEGLTSSAAAAVAASGSPHRTALGFGYDAGGAVVKYTYAGDANLDGAVDITDLGRIATYWQHNGDWTAGDFNYDTHIDIADLGILASNWQQGLSNPSAMSFNQALAAIGFGGATVPEPTACLALFGAVSLLLSRPSAASSGRAGRHRCGRSVRRILTHRFARSDTSSL